MDNWQAIHIKTTSASLSKSCTNIASFKPCTAHGGGLGGVFEAAADLFNGVFAPERRLLLLLLQQTCASRCLPLREAAAAAADLCIGVFAPDETNAAAAADMCIGEFAPEEAAAAAALCLVIAMLDGGRTACNCCCRSLLDIC